MLAWLTHCEHGELIKTTLGKYNIHERQRTNMAGPRRRTQCPWHGASRGQIRTKSTRYRRIIRNDPASIMRNILTAAPHHRGVCKPPGEPRLSDDERQSLSLAQLASARCSMHLSKSPWSQQTRCIQLHPSLFQCWASVFDADPTLKRHWVNITYALGCLSVATQINQGWKYNRMTLWATGDTQSPRGSHWRHRWLQTDGGGRFMANK